MASNMAHELMYRLIHEKPFKRSVPSIPKGTRSGLNNYTTYLSKAYWIDTTRCHLNGRLNCDQLFELFGAYSGKSASEVRRDMINYAKTMREDVINSCHIGMRLKGYRSLSDWIDIMERESTPGDEFCLYLLGKTYFRHVFVMTGENTWCTCETDRPLSIKELLEISSLHRVYLGQGQYGLLRKRVNTIQQRTVQQVRQQRTPSAGTLFNRACNYRRVQSRPLNLSGIPNVGPVSYVNRGRGCGARNYTNRGRIHINPVQQLQPHLQRQVSTSYNAPGFTITSKCIEQVNPLVGKSNESIRHPEVAQLVTELLGRTDHTPTPKSTSAYKYPEVEQVVTNLLKTQSPATVDLTTDSNDHDHDHQDKAVYRPLPEKPNTPGVSTIGRDNTPVSSGKVPDISPDSPESLDSSLLSAGHNHVELSDNEILCADKSPREDGELISADDCSTSDTTEELLEEMGLLSKAGAGCDPKVVKQATNSAKDVLTGNDTTTKPAIPDVGQEPMPVLKADPQESDHQKSHATSNSDPVTTKRELEKNNVVSSSNQTAAQSLNKDDPVITKRESENGGVVSSSDQTAVKLSSKGDPSAIIIVSDTELTDTDTVIVKQEPKDGELNELDPKHTFHMLQEQILNLQCKVEMHQVKKETLVSLGTITLFSDTDDSDITAVQKPDSIAPKLVKPKKEPVPNSDNDEESDNVNKPNNKRKRNVIESSTDSDSDDNIPLADLKRKLTPLPLPVKTVMKPAAKQSKRKRKKRLFTTKPPPTQTSKPIVNRGNVPTSDIDDDNTSPLDSETSGETNVINRSDSGYNSTSHDKLSSKGDPSAIIIVSDTELTDTDTVIVKQEPKDGELNELDPKHTFHMLQEQIFNLQCKVEMHQVKKETLVSLGTITLFSDTDDSDITAVQKPDSIAPKLVKPKKEPVPNSDNDEESDNVNKPNNKRKRNVIESSTDSDSDDNIPLADLKRKLTPLPLPVKTVMKPAAKQSKRKRKKRLFTTKPPPTQTSKPIVNRGNVPTSDIDDDNTSPLDSETSGETNVINRSDSGYNSTSHDDNKLAKPTENEDDIEPSTSKASPSVTSGTGKKRKWNFYCIKCDVVEPSLKELNDHFRNTHDWVHCHNCGKPFPTPSALSKHMYTHGAKLLQCEQCDKQFPFESQLTSHMISHDEEGQFACDQCPKKLKNKSDLKKHLSAHTDETFECKYCDVYVASDIHNLKGHLKTHDKLLRYVCRYCAKRFKHFNQRRRHQLEPNGCPKMPRLN